MSDDEKKTALSVLEQKLPVTKELAGSALTELAPFQKKMESVSKTIDPHLGAACNITLWGGFFLTGSVLWPIVACIGVGTAAVTLIKDKSRLQSVKNLKPCWNEAFSKIESQTREAVLSALRERQIQAIKLADEHLKAGGLLDEKVISYLACTPPEALKDASDQLAITVMQARQAIAYLRAPEEKLPATFAGLSQQFGVTFAAGSQKDRLILRKALQDADKTLDNEEGLLLLRAYTADVKIENNSMESPEMKALKRSSWGTIGRLYFAAAFFARDVRLHKELANIDFSKVKASAQIPALVSVGDFEELIEKYETAHGKLDLPALRGWTATRQRITQDLKPR